MSTSIELQRSIQSTVAHLNATRSCAHLAGGMSEEDVMGLNIVVNSLAAALIEVTEEWCKGFTGPGRSDLGSACDCVSLELHLLVTQITSQAAAMARKEARAR